MPGRKSENRWLASERVDRHVRDALEARLYNSAPRITTREMTAAVQAPRTPVREAMCRVSANRMLETPAPCGPRRVAAFQSGLGDNSGHCPTTA